MLGPSDTRSAYRPIWLRSPHTGRSRGIRSTSDPSLSGRACRKRPDTGDRIVTTCEPFPLAWAHIPSCRACLMACSTRSPHTGDPRRMLAGRRTHARRICPHTGAYLATCPVSGQHSAVPRHGRYRRAYGSGSVQASRHPGSPWPVLVWPASRARRASDVGSGVVLTQRSARMPALGVRSVAGMAVRSVFV